MKRNPALLLLGPTGSGKSPLGRQIELHGFGRCRAVHFDFGENLRETVVGNQSDENISEADIEFLRGVLDSGALLEDSQFHLAEKILRSFLASRKASEDVWVVLNGLPRHVGQAKAIDALLTIQGVVCLHCSADVVQARLANNVGGDRSNRCDDDLDRVRKKLEIFDQRTAPLVDHYRQQGVRIISIEVTPLMTAETAWQKFEEALR